MSVEVRLPFKCWKCDEAFEYTLHISPGETGFVHCPFCESECEFNADERHQRISELMRDGSSVIRHELKESTDPILTHQPTAKEP